MARKKAVIYFKTAPRSAVILVLLSALPAFAAEDPVDPVRLSAFYTVDYDNNVFRLSDSVNSSTLLGTSERSDVLQIAGVAVLVDMPLGRQRLRANVRATQNDYSRFNFLDHYGYDGRATLQWRVGNDWSGDVRYSRNKRLASFGDLRVPRLDLITTDDGDFLARYQLGASLALRARLSAVSSEHSSAADLAKDRRETSYEAGVEYVPANRNMVGLLARHTDGRLPNRTLTPTSVFDNSFQQDDLEATFDWRLSGLSLVSGFVGLFQRNQEQISGRDTSGVSAGIDYHWTPTGKTRLTFTARRQILPVDSLDSSYALTNLLSAKIEWNATAKTTLQLLAEHRQRDFLGDPAFVTIGQPEREDITNVLALSASYQALRSVNISGGVSYEKRTSNRALLDYTSKSAYLSGRFTF